MERCDQCNEEIVREEGSVSPGYGRDKLGNKICFKCCGENDSKELANALIGEKFYLYFTGKAITNWPGTLTINTFYKKESRHNWGLTRTDVWFKHQGNNFHGYVISHNTQVLHIKRIK